MKIIAHRGNDGIHRENSLEAILNSLSKDYIDGVEFDIRLTKDLNFIITHDPFYKGKFIRNTSSKYLKKQGLNTLNEVLKKIANKKIILIEVKEETNKYKTLSKKLYKILKKYPLNYYIMSFNKDFLEYFKNKYKTFKIGILIGKITNIKYINNNFDFSAVYYKNKSAKANFVWTINSIEQLKYVKNKQNIITDKSKLFKNLNLF